MSGPPPLGLSNLVLLLTAPSGIAALFAALAGHNLLQGAAAERERYTEQQASANNK